MLRIFMKISLSLSSSCSILSILLYWRSLKVSSYGSMISMSIAAFAATGTSSLGYCTEGIYADIYCGELSPAPALL